MISQWRKDEMRIKLKTLKKTVDDNDKANKAKLVEKVIYTPVFNIFSKRNFTGCRESKTNN